MSDTYAIVRTSNNRIVDLDDHETDYLAQEWFERRRYLHRYDITLVVMDFEDVLPPDVGDEVVWDEDGVAELA